MGLDTWMINTITITLSASRARKKRGGGNSPPAIIRYGRSRANLTTNIYLLDANRHQAAYDEALKNTDAYANTMKDYGIGSDNQQWLQSGAHLVTGLVAGNTKGAIAAAGELAAHVAAHVIADGKSTSELTQSEREQISPWWQVAGGVVGGLAGGETIM